MDLLAEVVIVKDLGLRKFHCKTSKKCFITAMILHSFYLKKSYLCDSSLCCMESVTVIVC